MSFKIEVSEFCERKYKSLLTYIESDENFNHGGIKGVSTKNGSFNKYYDSQTKFTPDQKYFFWMDFIKTKYERGEILIFRTKTDGKIFHLVMIDKENRFLDVYPEGSKI